MICVIFLLEALILFSDIKLSRLTFKIYIVHVPNDCEGVILRVRGGGGAGRGCGGELLQTCLLDRTQQLQSRTQLSRDTSTRNAQVCACQHFILEGEGLPSSPDGQLTVAVGRLSLCGHVTLLRFRT